MNKPECDYIRGIPPAIAIEQKVIARNPRSTVGTSTEIYEYLRLLYARIGHTYSPVSGEEVKKHTTEDVVQKMLEYSAGTRFVVMAPVSLPEGRTLEQQLKAYMQEGYARIYVDGNFERIDDFLSTSDTSHSTPHTPHIPEQSSPTRSLSPNSKGKPLAVTIRMGGTNLLT
jgi:excinuclease ABC subunit A